LVRSFVGQYLPILTFPREVRVALKRGVLILFEVHPSLLKIFVDKL